MNIHFVQHMKETNRKTNFDEAKMICRVEHNRQRLVRQEIQKQPNRHQ